MIFEYAGKTYNTVNMIAADRREGNGIFVAPDYEAVYLVAPAEGEKTHAIQIRGAMLEVVARRFDHPALKEALQHERSRRMRATKAPSNQDDDTLR